jgi:hypothetical protein
LFKIIIMNPQKIGGLIVLFLGVPLGFIAADHGLLFVAASLGLMMIFFARERINDERVQQLKMKAMFTAMSTGIAVTLLGKHYLYVIRQGTLDVRAPELTVWEFLAGVLLIALGLFHYWRWQDARPSRDAS